MVEGLEAHEGRAHAAPARPLSVPAPERRPGALATSAAPTAPATPRQHSHATPGHRLGGLVTLVVLLLAPAVQAEDAEYEQLIRDALVEFNHARWDEAYSLFSRAHELSPSARTLRGLGVVSYEQGDYPRAVTHLRAALDSDEKPLTGKTREQAEALLARATRLVGTLHVDVQPEQATLLVNYQRSDEREIKVPVGKVSLRAELDGYSPATRVVNVAGGRDYNVRLHLSRLTGVSDASEAVDQALTADAPEPRDSDGSLLESPWLWVGVGVLVAGGIVAAVALGQPDDVPGEKLPDGNVGATFTALRLR